MNAKFDRRDFLRFGATLTTGAALSGLSLNGCSPVSKKDWLVKETDIKPIDTVRVGFVGIGGRGMGLFNILLALEGVQVKAVCDIIPERVEKGQRLTEKAGQAKPAGYSQGPYDFKRMCENEDLDLVVTATPWEWHVPVSVEAMKNGKHAATEVPAAVTLDECWQLVETAEQTGKQCVMLENCCYFRNTMMLLKMVRAGVFGELLHCEAGYQHDVRNLKFSSEGGGTLTWRGQHSVIRNGNLYPTHAVGPVAQWININRGDRFDYLVSMSTKSRGMNVYAAEHFGEDHPLAKKKYALGDVNTSIIHTVNGLTVTLYHDTQSPRPLDYETRFIYRVQGTKGIHEGTIGSVYIEGVSPDPNKGKDAWEPLFNYADKYEHPLWKALRPIAKKHGHGGADFMELYRMVQALRKGQPQDMDVYDAAVWSAISALSEKSVANRSNSVDFPDLLLNL